MPGKIPPSNGSNGSRETPPPEKESRKSPNPFKRIWDRLSSSNEAEGSSSSRSQSPSPNPQIEVKKSWHIANASSAKYFPKPENEQKFFSAVDELYGRFDSELAEELWTAVNNPLLATNLSAKINGKIALFINLTSDPDFRNQCLEDKQDLLYTIAKEIDKDSSGALINFGNELKNSWQQIKIEMRQNPDILPEFYKTFGGHYWELRLGVPEDMKKKGDYFLYLLNVLKYNES